MQCGAKCFIVELEKDGKMIYESVFARTPAAARKTVRKHYGKETEIYAVRKD